MLVDTEGMMLISLEEAMSATTSENQEGCKEDWRLDHFSKVLVCRNGSLSEIMKWWREVMGTIKTRIVPFSMSVLGKYNSY